MLTYLPGTSPVPYGTAPGFSITPVAPTAPAPTGTLTSPTLVTYSTSTVYSTTELTITSCADTVTHCPAGSTIVKTSLFPVSTTVNTLTQTAGVPPASSPLGTGAPFPPVGGVNSTGLAQTGTGVVPPVSKPGAGAESAPVGASPTPFSASVPYESVNTYSVPLSTPNQGRCQQDIDCVNLI